jgi:hypothetical protein
MVHTHIYRFVAVSLTIIFLFYNRPTQRYSNLSMKTKLVSMDLPGAVFFSGGMTCLLLALRLSQNSPWSNPAVVSSLFGFGLMTLIFIGIQFNRGDNCTIPPRIIKQPTIFIGCVFTATIAMILFTHISYLPYFGKLGDHPESKYMIPYLASAIIISAGGGIAITILGFVLPFAISGSFVLIMGCSFLTLLKNTDKKGTENADQLLIGMGVGCIIHIPFLATQAVLSREEIPKAISLITFFNALGGLIAAPIARAIFHTSARDVEVILGHLRNSTNASQNSTSGRMDLIIEAQEHILRHVFILPVIAACVAFLCSFFFGWRSLKRE